MQKKTEEYDEDNVITISEELGFIPKGELEVSLKVDSKKDLSGKLGVYLMHDKAKIPTKGTEKASCFDVYAAFEERVEILQIGSDNVEIQTYTKSNSFSVYPGARVLVPTGIKFDIPDNHDVLVFARSGLSFKSGLILTNSVGIIDEDYRGELLVSMTNLSDATVVIKNGERIAQIMLRKKDVMDVYPLTNYDSNSTLRSEGGFGSTGSK